MSGEFYLVGDETGVEPSPDLVEPDTLAEYGHGSEESRVPSDSQAVNRTIARSEFDPDRA